ncbi:MAG TPA: DEAD/DEAH box helicase [Actinocrinis sp.]
MPTAAATITAEAAAAAAPAAHTFADLGVLTETVEALDALGITAPFPIQVATIPVALSGADVIGQAKTGTGKTLAFGIPVLQRVAGPGSEPAASAAEPAAAAVKASGSSGRRRRGRGPARPASSLPAAHGAPQALVVVPTRELAVQVTNDLLDAGKVRAIRVHALYGGRAYEPQVAALREGIDIAVGTPGRLLDLARQSHLELGGVRTLVLDEADEMLDLGFLPDVERIIAQLPAERQTMLFSATMPGQVISLARQYMNRPTHIRAADPDDPGVTVKNIAHFVYRAHSLDKTEMLARILQARGRGLTMIFARTKRTVAKVAEELADRHFAVAAVHGDLGQGAREQALRAFRNGKIDVLVATDVAARGIDVEGVTHVINFQCPEDEKVYTHRTGRTGRAGAKGTAVTLVDWDEVPRWNLINKALGLSHHEPAETYSTSPQFYAELDIPESVKGVLPRLERVREGLGAEEIEDLGETGRSRQAHAAPKAPRADRAERTERTPRKRNRTRRGITIDASGAEAGAAAETGAPDISGDVLGDTAPAQDDTARTERGTGRRRSRRSSAAQTPETALDPAAETETESPIAAAPAQKDAATAPRARKRTRSRSSATAAVAAEQAGGSVKLAPGSLATPREAVPAAPSEAAEPTAPSGATEALQPSATARKRVRTRKSAAVSATPAQSESGSPAAESAEQSAPKAPRKRAPRKLVAAEQAPPSGVVSAPVTDHEELSPGPIANPNRTQVKAARVRKAATRAAGAPRTPAPESQG